MLLLQGIKNVHIMHSVTHTFQSSTEVQLSNILFLYFLNLDSYGILVSNNKLHHLILPLRFLFLYLIK